MSNVRVRFAPSPTGPLHIGGLRTALYNYLFAKKNNGKFILRIEDTDQNRYVEGAEKYIENALQWSELSLDESPTLGGDFGPYRQSERTTLYKEFIPKIIASGNAYYAFDTPEELDALRKKYEKNKEVFSYNASNRLGLKNSLSIPKEEVQKKLDNNTPYVIRFKMPENESIILEDIIRGTFSVNSNTLDDKVLVKNDGTPTYHFANVIDDYLMQISHVIRGEEWLPSMPLHLLLYKAFNWNSPKFAHLPLILKPEGNGKLSKRDGAKFGFPVFPLSWNTKEETFTGFKEEGYFSKAVNYMLAILGWTPKNEDSVLSLEEMSQQFNFKNVHKAGARFDIQKAQYFNKQVLQDIPLAELTTLYKNQLTEKNINFSDFPTKEIVALLKERASFVKDIVSESVFFYQAPTVFPEKAIKKVWKENTQTILTHFLLTLQKLPLENEEEIQQNIKAFTEEQNIGFGAIMMPLRLSLVGEMKGPDVPLIMKILGKEEVVKRIHYFLETN